MGFCKMKADTNTQTCFTSCPFQVEPFACGLQVTGSKSPLQAVNFYNFNFKTQLCSVRAFNVGVLLTFLEREVYLN